MKPICGSRGFAGPHGCILDKGHDGDHRYGDTVSEENRREKAYVRGLEQQLAVLNTELIQAWQERNVAVAKQRRPGIGAAPVGIQ